MTTDELRDILENGAAVVEFIRRTDPTGKVRRMLCTCDNRLLLGEKWSQRLGYQIPTSQLPYNPETHGLVVVWDIIKRAHRTIPADSATVTEQWSYDEFPSKYKNIIKMSYPRRNKYMLATKPI